INQVFSTLPWYRLVPGNCVTAGGGTLGGSDYVSAAVTPQGDAMVAYVPNHHLGSVSIDLTRISGTFHARWWGPRAGTFTNVQGSPFSNKGVRAFSTPGKNAAGDLDWLLVLTTVSAASPVPAFPRWGSAALLLGLFVAGASRRQRRLSGAVLE